MQIERFASGRSKGIEAIGKQTDGVVVLLHRGRVPGFQFEAQFSPSDFSPPFYPSHALAQQVPRDSDQPGPHQRRAIESGVGSVTAEKHFLAKVFGVGRFEQACPQIPVNRPLMPPDQRRESGPIAALRRFNQRMIFGAAMPGRIVVQGVVLQSSRPVGRRVLRSAGITIGGTANDKIVAVALLRWPRIGLRSNQ